MDERIRQVNAGPGAARSAHALLDVADSVLLVIDVQAGFVEKLEPARRGPLIERIAWLIRVAERLAVPVLATVENRARHGPSVAPVAAALPATAAELDKQVFGLADDAMVMPAVTATGRHTAVLTGLETDACVAHSALGLLDRGFRVAVVRDAVGSPGTAHEHGLDRMRDAGVIVSSTKGLYYEWLRTVAAAEQMGTATAPEPPAGLVL